MATERTCQVLIIGAGISGLSAAQRLQENDISDYIILEATDRVGGRIKTLSKTEGKIFGKIKMVYRIGLIWMKSCSNQPNPVLSFMLTFK